MIGKVVNEKCTQLSDLKIIKIDNSPYKLHTHI